MKTFLTGAALVLFISFMATFAQGLNDPALHPIIGCEKKLKHFLTSPSTAEFGLETVAQLPSGAYRITNTVDSQNGFGATVRSRFTCVAYNLGEDRVHVKSLELNGEPLI